MTLTLAMAPASIICKEISQETSRMAVAISWDYGSLTMDLCRPLQGIKDHRKKTNKPS